MPFQVKKKIFAALSMAHGLRHQCVFSSYNVRGLSLVLLNTLLIFLIFYTKIPPHVLLS